MKSLETKRKTVEQTGIVFYLIPGGCPSTRSGLNAVFRSTTAVRCPICARVPCQLLSRFSASDNKNLVTLYASVVHLRTLQMACGPPLTAGFAPGKQRPRQSRRLLRDDAPDAAASSLRKCGNTLRQRCDEVGLQCMSKKGSPSPPPRTLRHPTFAVLASDANRWEHVLSNNLLLPAPAATCLTRFCLRISRQLPSGRLLGSYVLGGPPDPEPITHEESGLVRKRFERLTLYLKPLYSRSLVLDQKS